MKTHVTSNWSHALLVCRKCQKKLKGGFGPDGRMKLSKALKRELGGGKGRKARLGIVEAPCFDICPKRAVVLVDSRRPGHWHLVGRDADLAALAAELGAPDQR